MSDDLRNLLPVLQPPAGGLARLHGMVAAERRVAPAWRAAALLLVAAAAAIAITARLTPETHHVALSDDPVMAALTAKEGNSLTVRDPQRMAAARVPTSDAVVYFRVDGVR